MARQRQGRVGQGGGHVSGRHGCNEARARNVPTSKSLKQSTLVSNKRSAMALQRELR